MKPYRLHGMMQSYFTRKMNGYLDYKGIPYLFRRFSGFSPESEAAGYTGGMPPMQTPDGEWMWDSTSMIHHLELRFPEPALFPPDPVQRFLDYVVEDAADEWYYRTAVGSRWSFPENHQVGGYELARDAASRGLMTADQAYTGVQAHVTGSLEPLGVTPENVQLWMDDVLRPWLRVLGNHFNERPYLFGARPSLGDFGIFGGNAAHFVNDPLCRRWADADGPGAVRHTYALFQPEDQVFGEWDAGEIPATLIAILAEIGRIYLPWVSRACIDGSADVVFASGARAHVKSTEFLRETRSVLLARYASLREPRLDAVLERAGILKYFADYVQHAGKIPDYRNPPRPALNRPFPPPF